MLNEAELALIRRQAGEVAMLGHAFGAECLARACWANPWMRGHLPRDVQNLRIEIPPAIDMVTGLLDRPERLEALLESYLDRAGGRVPLHVLLVLAEALVATLRSRFEEEFTASAEQAWRKLLGELVPRLAAPDALPNAA
ncbi:MAG: globin [Beijerinckiaceae bacterium]|nr:globin [Beijerinckiaceae bacterium]MCZ8301504.1 globin [Beijerinckiaceae bacterium]